MRSFYKMMLQNYFLLCSDNKLHILRFIKFSICKEFNIFKALFDETAVNPMFIFVILLKFNFNRLLTA
jgi:hypothetical protein